MLCVSPFLVIRTLRGRKSNENESKNYYQEAAGPAVVVLTLSLLAWTGAHAQITPSSDSYTNTAEQRTDHWHLEESEVGKEFVNP